MSKHLITHEPDLILLQKDFAEKLREIVPTKASVLKTPVGSVHKVDGKSIKTRPDTIDEFFKMSKDLKAANILLWFRSEEAGYLSTNLNEHLMSRGAFLQKWGDDIKKVAEIWKELNQASQYGHNGPFAGTAENQKLKAGINSIDIESLDTHFEQYQRDAFWKRNLNAVKKTNLTNLIEKIELILVTTDQGQRKALQEEIRIIIHQRGAKLGLGGVVSSNIRPETEVLRNVLSRNGFGIQYNKRSANLRTELNQITQRWINNMHQTNIVEIVDMMGVIYDQDMYVLRVEGLQDTAIKYEIRQNPQNMPGELVSLRNGVARIDRTINKDNKPNRRAAIDAMINHRGVDRSTVNVPSTVNLLSTAMVTQAESTLLNSYEGKLIKGISVTRIPAGTAVIPVGGLNSTELLIYENVLNKHTNVIIDGVQIIKSLNMIKPGSGDVDRATKRLLQAYDKDRLNGDIIDNLFDSVFDFSSIEAQHDSKVLTGVEIVSGRKPGILQKLATKDSSWRTVLNSVASTQSISAHALINLQFTEEFKIHLKANPGTILSDLYDSLESARNKKVGGKPAPHSIAKAIISENGIQHIPISFFVNAASASYSVTYAGQSYMKGFYNLFQQYTAVTSFKLKPLNVPYPLYFTKTLLPQESFEKTIAQELKVWLGIEETYDPELDKDLYNDQQKRKIQFERDLRDKYKIYYKQYVLIDDAARFLIRYSARNVAGSEYWATNQGHQDYLKRSADIGFTVPPNTDVSISPRVTGNAQGTLSKARGFFLPDSIVESGKAILLALPHTGAEIYKELTKKIYRSGNPAFIEIIFWIRTIPSQLEGNATFEELILANQNPLTMPWIIDDDGISGKGNKGKKMFLSTLHYLGKQGLAGGNKGAWELYKKGIQFHPEVQGEIQKWMRAVYADFDRHWDTVADENYFRNRLSKARYLDVSLQRTDFTIDSDARFGPQPVKSSATVPRSGAMQMPFLDTRYILRAMNMLAVSQVVPAFTVLKYRGTKTSDLSFMDDIAQADGGEIKDFFDQFHNVIDDNIADPDHRIGVKKPKLADGLIVNTVFIDDKLNELYIKLLNGTFSHPYDRYSKGGNPGINRMNMLAKLGDEHPRFLAYEHQLSVRKQLFSVFAFLGANKNSQYDLNNTRPKAKKVARLKEQLDELENSINAFNQKFVNTQKANAKVIQEKMNSTVNFSISSMLDNSDYVLEDGNLFFFQDGIKINTNIPLDITQIDAINNLQGKGLNLAVVIKDGMKYLEVRQVRGIPSATGGVFKTLGKAGGAILALIPIDAIAGVIFHYDNEQMFKDWWDASSCDPHTPACKAKIKAMHENLSEAARVNFIDNPDATGPLWGITPREAWSGTSEFAADAYYMVMHQIHKIVSNVPWDEILEGTMRSIIDVWENDITLYEFKLQLEQMLFDLRNMKKGFLEVFSEFIDVYHHVYLRSAVAAEAMWDMFVYVLKWVGHGIARAFDLISVLWSVATDLDSLRLNSQFNTQNISTLIVILSGTYILKTIEGMPELIKTLQAKQLEAENLMSDEDKERLNDIIYQRTGMGY